MFSRPASHLEASDKVVRARPIDIYYQGLNCWSKEQSLSYTLYTAASPKVLDFEFKQHGVAM